MTNKHSTLPWIAKQFDGKFINNGPYELYAENESTTSSSIKDSLGRIVCIVPEIHDGSFEEGERHAHLQTIVTAVNNYDRLRDALEGAADCLEEADYTGAANRIRLLLAEIEVTG